MNKKISLYISAVVISLNLMGCENSSAAISKDPIAFTTQYEKDTSIKKEYYQGKYMEWEGTVTDIVKNDTETNTIIFCIGYVNQDDKQPILVEASGAFDKNTLLTLNKDAKVNVKGKFEAKESNTKWKLIESEIVTKTE